MKYLDKIMSWEEAAARRKGWAAQGLRVVFTNGCFDLLHPGHLRYLAEARGKGDFLMVGLNADASITRLKGPSRPICPQDVRAEMLAGLEFVDVVTIFEEDTPLALITLISPDLLVKGGDWKPEQIVGADVVLAGGGEVCSLLLAEGFSTTALIERIRR